MNKAKESKTKEEAKMQKWAKWTLGIGALLIFIAPGIITHCTSCISFSDTGPIGDTIGGITAPIVNFMGALLVYYALRAQINANKLIFDQFEYQKMSTYIMGQIASLREDIKDFIYEYEPFSGETEIKTYYGREAFLKIFCSIDEYNYNCYTMSMIEPKIVSMYYFIDRLNLLAVKIDGSDLESNDKRQFFEMIIYIYEVNFKNIIESHQYKMEKIYGNICNECGLCHTAKIISIYVLSYKINALADKLKQEPPALPRYP